MEVQQIAEGRHVSTLSTRNRYNRLQELEDARDCLDWAGRMEKMAAIGRENAEKRRRELECLEEATREIRAIREERAETRFSVEEALVKETKNNLRKSRKDLRYLGLSGDANRQKESCAAW